MTEIFPGSEYIFQANRDGVAVGRCKRDFVVVMVLQVVNAAVMEKVMNGVIKPHLGNSSRPSDAQSRLFQSCASCCIRCNISSRGFKGSPAVMHVVSLTNPMILRVSDTNLSGEENAIP